MFVAGADTRTRWYAGRPGASYVGLRFSRGLGPALVGTAADELQDVSPDLASCGRAFTLGCWPSRWRKILRPPWSGGSSVAPKRAPVDLLGSAVFELAARTPGDCDSGISVHPPIVPTGDERRNPVRPRRCDDPRAHQHETTAPVADRSLGTIFCNTTVLQ